MATQTDLKAVVSADTSQAQSEMKGFAGSLDNAKASIAAMGAIAAGVFAATVSEIKDATDAASEHQNTQAQLAAVIKSTGGASGETVDQINALAESLQKTTGYSADTTEKVDTLLLGFKDIGSNVMPGATQAILDFATRTGSDAVEATNMLGKALANPKDAVAALTREHVVLSAAQQQSIKDFVAAGNTAGAQGVIIAALNDTFGGAAEQTQTMAFQQRLLNSQIEEVQESIGNALLPVITSLMAKLEPLISAIVSWTEKHPELTKDILLVVAGVSGLIVVLTALAGVVLLVNVAMSPVSLIILAIVAAIALFVAAAYEITTHWGAITAFFQKLWDDVTGIFDTAIKDIIAFFQPLIDVVQKVANAISTVASGIGSAVSAVGKTIGSAVSSVIPHASGGSVVPGQSYLVGENGPEVMQFGGTGFITPNYALAGGGGITVNINGGQYLSENAAMDMANKVVDVLKRRTRIGV